MRVNPLAIFFIVFTTLVGTIIGYLFGDVLLGSMIGAAGGTGIVLYATVE